MDKGESLQEKWDSMEDNSLVKFNEDVRGALYRCKVGGVGFSVVYTKAGGIRSGEIHPNKQFDLILSGEFLVWTLKNKKIIKKRYKENQLVTIPPKTPHLFFCKKDSVMLEWWDGPFRVEYYAPFRKYVEEQFKK